MFLGSVCAGTWVYPGVCRTHGPLRAGDFGPDFRRHFGASGAMPRWQAWTAVSAIPVVEARDLDARVRAVEMGDTYGVWGGLAQTKSRESCGGSGPSLPKRNRCFWADSSPDPGENRFLSFSLVSKTIWPRVSLKVGLVAHLMSGSGRTRRSLV